MTAGKRMPSHEEQVEDQDSKTESIVILGATYIPEHDALQLRWCVFRHTDLAPERPAIRLHLKGVAVDQRHQRSCGDQDVARVDVSHQVLHAMNGLEGRCTVGGSVDEERPVRVGELALSVRWAVELVNLLVADDLRHGEAAERTVGSVVKSAHRPRGDARQVLSPGCDHRSQLVGPVLVGRVFVQLRDQGRLAGHVEHRALPAAANQPAEWDRPATMIKDLRGCHRRRSR